MKIRTLAALVAVAGGILATPVLATPAAAQTGEALISTLFRELEKEFQDSGRRMARVASFQNGINAGSGRADAVRLDAGKTYWVIGVCDEDCSDFDLEVKDANGQVVGSDVLDDDAPMVVLENVRGGSYQIGSMMAVCSVDPCLAGVRVYRAD